LRQNRSQKLHPALLVKIAKIAKINSLFIFVLPSNSIVPANWSPRNSTPGTMMCKRIRVVFPKQRL
jgi:hypothetical protein